MSRVITVFDTTLRDGEQSPGACLGVDDKVEIAHQLDKMQVDVIEAGFAISSPEDWRAVRRVAEEVRRPIICSLCRATEKDIVRAWEALQVAERARLHVFIATSDLHIAAKLQSTRDEVLRRAVESVRLASSMCNDVEFSAEDATRSDLDYLCEVVEAVIAAGATTINVPDTVGYALPQDIQKMIQRLLSDVPNINQAVISVHNHNDLGLAVANTLASIEAGAGQVECTVNGIGERAGNASLEEVVMAIRTRSDALGCETGVASREISKSSRMVSGRTGIVVQPNKAIVGANAFAHEAGIHQDGMLKNPLTYEIMRPQDVGVVESALTLGRRSGKHGLKARLEDLGYQVKDEEIDVLYRRFVQIADHKKQVYDEDLEMMMREYSDLASAVWALEDLQITSGQSVMPTATVRLTREGVEYRDAACGNGPVDAAYLAIQRIVGVELTLEDYSLRSITVGQDAMGEATIRVRRNGYEVVGRAASTDVVEASAKAYLNAINRLLVLEAREAEE